jgi:hypothetical protein
MLRGRFGVCILVVIGAIAPNVLGADKEGKMIRVTVDAGEVERQDTPVNVELTGEAKALGAGACKLEELSADGKRAAVACQVEPGEAARLWFVLAGKTAKGAKRTYELSAAGALAPGEPAARAVKDDKAVELLVGKSPVLRYNHAAVEPPAGASPLYRRSGFIHPLWSPAGEELTGIHPKDHIHHMGIWGPWTSTKFEGRKVDFWNLKDGSGTVRFVKFAGLSSGEVFAGFEAMQDHVDLKAPGGEKVALNERLSVRAWNVGGPAAGWWLVDYVTTQRCATGSPLELPAYRYGGGIGFRGTGKWVDGKADYLTSEGKTRRDGHGTRARWCDMHGPTDRGPAGVVIMSCPANHEHPEPMRIWESGGVFFNFCPVQQKDWTLRPGNEYTLRYRVYVYSGKLDVTVAERMWADWANPPKAAAGK